MLAAEVLQCWTVLMCFVSATAAVKGYFTASKVLWSWDSCCEASPCSQTPPGWTFQTCRMTSPLVSVGSGQALGSRVLFLPQGLCCRW